MLLSPPSLSKSGLYEVHLSRNSGPQSRRPAPATGVHADIIKSVTRRTGKRPPRPRVFYGPREERRYLSALPPVLSHRNVSPSPVPSTFLAFAPTWWNSSKTFP